MPVERSEEEWQQIALYLEPIIAGRELESPILRQIPGDCLSDLWPLIGFRLEPLVERSRGRWTLEGICKKIAADDWQLWLVWDGKARALVGTEINTHMSGMKVANIVFATGSNPDRWISLISDIEDWAKRRGCACVEAMARPGWGKYLAQYRKTHIILDRDLTDARQQTNHHDGTNDAAMAGRATAGHC